MDDGFALIIHPASREQLFGKLKFLRRWPPWAAEGLIKRLPPVKLSDITGIRSAYAQTAGCFISANLALRGMAERSGFKAARLGARIAGLGPLAALAFDGNAAAARHFRIAVTTGRSYIIAAALEASIRALQLMGADPAEAEVLILDAACSSGDICARLLAREGVNFLTLVGRGSPRLDRIARWIMHDSGVSCMVSSQVKKAVARADLIIAVSSEVPPIAPSDLKSGAVVCDLAVPPLLSGSIGGRRGDVLIIEGGLVEVPGDLNSFFDPGLPPRIAYPWMVEGMLLALEKRFENYSLGPELRIGKVEHMRRLAVKHGFKMAGFSSGERYLNEAAVGQIRKRARPQGLLSCSP